MKYYLKPVETMSGLVWNSWASMTDDVPEGCKEISEDEFYGVYN